MLPLIAKYLHWYVADCCGCIAGLNDQNKQRHMPYHIRQMSVNGTSTIGGHVSWVNLGGDRLHTVRIIVLAAFSEK